MANEFKHKSAGTTLTQVEDDDVDRHLFDSQAVGDMLYASSVTQLSRLGIGATNAVLLVIAGVPSWVTNPTIASPTFTGTVTMNANLINVNKVYATGIGSYLGFWGGGAANGKGGFLEMPGNATSYGFLVATSNAAQNADRERLRISQNLDTAVLTLSNTLCAFNLPTSNPGAGYLWNDTGTVKVGT